MITKQITRVLAALPLRTGRVSIVPASLQCLVTLLAAAFAAGPAQAQPGLLVASNNTGGKYAAVTGAVINPSFFSPPGAGFYPMVVDQYNHFFVAGIGTGGSVVSEYNATTGATINLNFITIGLTNVWGLALDGNNHLFVSENGGDNTVVGKYDATTGATINASFIQDLVNPVGLANAHGVAADNKNHLFVTDSNANTVGEYDATTGATINAAFIKSQGQGLHDPQVLLLDGHNHLFVGDNYDTATVGEYDATTGATINAAFVPGLSGGTWALALDGSNHLFVGNDNSVNGVGEYDATTGVAINEHFITGLHYSNGPGLAFVTPVPEPSTFVLAAFGFVGVIAWRLRGLLTGPLVVAATFASPAAWRRPPLQP
jgi:hypothetical protein